MTLIRELAQSKLIVFEAICIVTLFSSIWIMPVPLITDEAEFVSGLSAQSSRIRLSAEAGPVPSLLLSGMLDHGINAASSLRLPGLLLHTLNSMLAAQAAVSLFGFGLLPAACCGIVFAVYPAHSLALFFPFSIGQIAAVTILLLALIDFSVKHSPGRILAWTAAGLACHPLALATPLLCLAASLTAQEKTGAARSAALAGATALLCAGIWLLYRFSSALQHPDLPQFKAYLGFLGRSFLALAPLRGHAGLLLAAIAALLLCGVFAAGRKWLGLKRISSLLLICLVLALLPLLPALDPAAHSVRKLVPEHNSYLLALGPALLAGAFASALRRHKITLLPVFAALLLFAINCAVHIPQTSKRLAKDSSYWSQISEVYPRKPVFLNKLAQALILEGDSVRAIEPFKLALKSNKGNAEEAAVSMRGIGEIALGLESPSMAIRYLATALKANPRDQRSKELLAMAYLPTKQRRKAQALLASETEPALVYRRAIVNLNLREYGTAFKDFEAACKLDGKFCTAF